MPKRPRERDSDVLRVLTLEDSNAASVSPDLATFLAPMTPDEFRREVYRNKALAIKVAPKMRDQRTAVIKSLMCDFRPQQMLAQSNSEEGISVWMKAQGQRTTATAEGEEGEAAAAAVAAAPAELRSFKTDPVSAKVCFDAGAALYFRGTEPLEAAFLPSLMAQLGHGFASFFRDGMRRGESEVFVAHPGHTTSWHFDFQENFTVQLLGTKRWSLARRGAVPHPARACATHFSDADNVAVLHAQHQIHRLADPGFIGYPPEIETECETVTLQPGDVLYHPAGMWHKVETLDIGGTSVSVNFSLFPQTWADLLTETAQHAALSRPALRERISFSSGADARRQIEQRLRLLGSDLLALNSWHVLPPVVVGGGEGAAPVSAEEGKAKKNKKRTEAESPDEAARAAATASQPTEVPHPLLWLDGGNVSGAVDGASDFIAALPACGAGSAIESVVRNPLAVLSLTEDSFATAIKAPRSKRRAEGGDDDSDDDDEFEEVSSDDDDNNDAEGVACPEGFSRFDLHSNFFAGEATLGAAPAVHRAFFVAPSQCAAMTRLALLAPGTPTKVAALKSSVPMNIIRVMLALGFLAPHSVAAAQK